MISAGMRMGVRAPHGSMIRGAGSINAHPLARPAHRSRGICLRQRNALISKGIQVTKMMAAIMAAGVGAVGTAHATCLEKKGQT